jgi:hypothetical protein
LRLNVISEMIATWPGGAWSPCWEIRGLYRPTQQPLIARSLSYFNEKALMEIIQEHK